MFISLYSCYTLYRNLYHWHADITGQSACSALRWISGITDTSGYRADNVIAFERADAIGTQLSAIRKSVATAQLA